MKSTMTSVQPYWVFLIIAEAKGWKIPQKKEVEVRKDYPKAKDWDRTNYIYCGQNKASFNRIPKEYQPLMRPLLGKVVAEFTCDRINEYDFFIGHGVCGYVDGCESHCLTREELVEYGKGKTVYGWHISDLKVYDTTKELGEFYSETGTFAENDFGLSTDLGIRYMKYLRRPPQSWFYVEEVSDG